MSVAEDNSRYINIELIYGKSGASLQTIDGTTVHLNIDIDMIEKMDYTHGCCVVNKGLIYETYKLYKKDQTGSLVEILYLLFAI